MDIRGIKAGIPWVLLLLLPVLARAQDTAPVSQNFPVLGYERVQSLFKGQSGLLPVSSSTWGRSSELNINAFSPNMANGIDSVYYPIDSLSVLTGETVYQFEVTGNGYGATVTNNTDNDYVGSDSTLTLKVNKRAYGVDSTASYTVWKNNANRRVIDNLGLTFESDVAIGDKFIVAITYDVPVEVDWVSKGMVYVEFSEAQKHQGNGFSVFADSSLAGANDTLEILIITPPGKRLHVTFQAYASAACYVFMKESVTGTVFDDTLTIFNDDRRSPKTSGAIAMKAPRTNDSGTSLYPPVQIGSGAPFVSGSHSASERILKASTSYSIGIHSTAAAVTSLLVEFTEHKGP